MKIKAIVLGLFVLSSNAFAGPATHDGLMTLLSNVANSVNQAMIDASGEPIESTKNIRNDFFNTLSSLKELKTLTDLESVQSKSGKPIQDLKGSIQELINVIPVYEQTVSDFDQYLKIFESQGPNAPELTEASEKLGYHVFAYSGFLGQTPELHALNVAIKLFRRLQD